jgi:hypothetical protein
VWGKLKSNNRQATAWWCGLPVVDGQELDAMRDMTESAEARQMVAVGNRKIAEAHYDVHQSVRELMAVVREIKGEVKIASNGSVAELAGRILEAHTNGGV